jgi:hypothetical protein
MGGLLAEIMIEASGLDKSANNFRAGVFLNLQFTSARIRRAGVTLCTTVMLLERLRMCDIIHSLLSGATSR